MADKKIVIGSLLQKARRQKKIKISRAVEDLRIPKKYLYAFENNDLTPFPSPAYAVGFLKNYADYLGLDATPLVDDLKDHFGHEPLDDSLLRAPELPGRRWLPIVGIVLLVLLILTGAYFGWSYFKGDDYEISANDEMPAHLAAFLVDEVNEVPSDPQASKVANEINAYFNELALGAKARVRVLATMDVKVVIKDRLGKILQEGILYSGDSIELPQGAGLNVHTPDLTALGFYIGDIQASPSALDGRQNNEFYLVSLDNLQPSSDKTAPAS